MIQFCKTFYRNKPLPALLFIGLIVRLLAALFSKGYGMTDDHYKIIGEAYNLMIGNITDSWGQIEGSNGGKRSILYPYLHYLLFSFLEYFSVKDPQSKMYVVRVLHALYSLLIISFSYKITAVLSNEKVAKKVGLIAALFWFLPMLSVRNLIEVVSIPLLMGGTYYTILGLEKLRKDQIFIWAGILLGYAFSVRYQTLAFTGGLGLILLLRKNWKGALLFSIGVIIPLVLNHYVLESLVFGFPPFIKIWNYINFNVEHATTYITGPWYNFILLFLGVLIPPFSFILAAGVVKAWKKYLILFVPFMLFFLFHSLFPGKQERFILPVFMFFPMLGLMGYEELKKGGGWFQQHPKFFKRSWNAFWIVNLILLVPITFTYSKKSKVEAMYHLVDKPKKEKDAILFCSGSRGDIITMPVFYMNIDWYPYAYRISSDEDLGAFKEKLTQLSEDEIPDYLFFFDHKQKEERIKRFKEIFPKMNYETTKEASFIDQFMHWLNPRNKNYAIDIYKTNK